MTEIKIAGYAISKESFPFIIAEAGINHNGELDKAYEMIKIAKTAGADAVKFQTFRAEEFVGDPAMTYTYKSQGKEVTESMLEMFKRYEFRKDEWFSIKKRCDEEGIIFLSTPQNMSDLDLLLEMGIPAIKVGSDDFTNIPLLKSYAKTGLPIILSCGMADFDEVNQTLESLGSLKGYPTGLLLCTSEYPTPPEDVHLRKLTTLTNNFPDLPLGFSDHTEGFLAASLAVAFGAVIFEKHFTLDNNLAGPDHWFSANPERLKEWVISIKQSYKMLGCSIIKPTATEEVVKKIARRSIVALSDIAEGEIITAEKIGLKRPGDGLSAIYYESVMGLKAARKIKQGEKLKLEDFING